MTCASGPCRLRVCQRRPRFVLVPVHDDVLYNTNSNLLRTARRRWKGTDHWRNVILCRIKGLTHAASSRGNIKNTHNCKRNEFRVRSRQQLRKRVLACSLITAVLRITINYKPRKQV